MAFSILFGWLRFSSVFIFCHNHLTFHINILVKKLKPNLNELKRSVFSIRIFVFTQVAEKIDKYFYFLFIFCLEKM